MGEATLMLTMDADKIADKHNKTQSPILDTPLVRAYIPNI